MSLYVHLCCSMGDILIIQTILVGWNFDMSIYVHLCCSMGDILIIQKISVGWKFEKSPFMSIYAAVWVIFYNSNKSKKASSRIEKIFYVHLWDILCTRFFSIPEDALKRKNFSILYSTY